MLDTSLAALRPRHEWRTSRVRRIEARRAVRAVVSGVSANTASICSRCCWLRIRSEPTVRTNWPAACQSRRSRTRRDASEAQDSTLAKDSKKKATCASRLLTSTGALDIHNLQPGRLRDCELTIVARHEHRADRHTRRRHVQQGQGACQTLCAVRPGEFARVPEHAFKIEGGGHRSPRSKITMSDAPGLTSRSPNTARVRASRSGQGMTFRTTILVPVDRRSLSLACRQCADWRSD